MRKITSYIVTYDLCGHDKDYSALIENIKKYSCWAHITESTWFIKTSQSKNIIRDNLMESMDGNDRLFVAELTGVAAWYNVKCSSDYLKNNL